MIRAAFACLAATVVVAGWWTPPAWAIGPPVVDAPRNRPAETRDRWRRWNNAVRAASPVLSRAPIQAYRRPAKRC